MKRICMDFDGVIHSYTSGWQGADVIPDPPVKGIEEVLRELTVDDHYIICIFSTRAATPKGRVAMWMWLEDHGLSEYIHEVRNDKPPASAYVDDRAVYFDGNTKELADKIHQFVEEKSK